MNQQKLISFSEASSYLLQGKVGVIPTDTIYGLAASAHNQKAVEILYGLKHREQKPGTVIAADIQQLYELGISKTYLDRVAPLWPASLSVVLPIAIRPYLHQEVGSLAVRVVANPEVQALLEQTGPLLTSSANLPAQTESHTIHEAWNYFGDKVDFYVDGGDLSGRHASTIIRLSPDHRVEILRQGSVEVPSFL